MNKAVAFILFFSLWYPFAVSGQDVLPDTQPLEHHENLPAEMVKGISGWLTKATQAARDAQTTAWKPNQSSAEAFNTWMTARRDRLRKIIGATDAREPITAIQRVKTGGDSLLAKGDGYQIHQVRWPVLKGVDAAGLLLEPDSPRASVVVLPDADWTPEQVAGLAPGLPEDAQFARRLAENGCRVLVPVLIDRADTFSGNPAITMTNQPHREFVYRAAFEMGRHIIGYEVQKVLAAVDFFARETESKRLPIGVVGYGEGGLIAFYSAALDPRIDAVVVSGYFGPRDSLWQEPIYRNVWTLLRDFSDEEILTLIAPRTAIIEASREPQVNGPPTSTADRKGAAPGRLQTPPIEAIRDEFERASHLLANPDLSGRFELVEADQGGLCPIGSTQTMVEFLHALGIHEALKTVDPPKTTRELPDAVARMKEQFDQLNQFTQGLVKSGDETRKKFWAKADGSSVEKWKETTKFYRDYLWTEVIGHLPTPTIPIAPRTRRAYDEPKWQGWEVRLDVYPEVFASGILLVPRDIPSGKKLPVVVCQHGLEGTSADTITDEGQGFRYYQSFARRLVERGYVVYSPQNPYIGDDKFRLCQRQANPLGLSLFSFIVAQHQRTLEWLATLPFVDPQRIGFYGLSYGGKTAMRVPALLPQYVLSICSGDFNDWIAKITSIDWKGSYMFFAEWEICDFDLGSTFNYADLAGLIAPRPFMVERGHQDPVGLDEWVAREYDKIQRLYATLGIPNLTTIEYFDGPHQIHGVGTFEFLDRFLKPGTVSTKPTHP